MKILIAPDKFKGSLTAREVCNAITDGLQKVDRSLNIQCVPLADGGEGTCDLLTEFCGGFKIKMRVLDPLMREIDAEYGISPDGATAFVEMAKASGLQLLKREERNPLRTSTFGTGQLVSDALARGASKIILAIGGSATNDGGAGMAEALGYEFLSDTGQKIKPTGQNLIDIKSINDKSRNPRISKAEFVVIYDVKNPLYGNEGAAAVFAAQKGATPEEIIFLDRGLEQFARVVLEQFKIDINFPGAGAAGGLGGGARFFLGAASTPGIDFVVRFTNLEKQVSGADLVITGEGKIDTQTFLGKVVYGVSSLATRHHKTCIGFTGKLDLSESQIKELGLQKIVSLTSGAVTDHDAMTNAYSLLSQAAFTALEPLIKSSPGRSI